jgi:hypothetical protein
MILVRLFGGRLGVTMKIRQTIAASAIALVAMSLSAANAAVYNFDFLSADTSYHAAGTFTTGSLVVSDPVFGYRITDVTGHVSGSGGGNISGLVEPATYADYPNHSTSPMGAFWIDNTYFPDTPPNITLWGVAFTTGGGGNEWNLWANNWNPTAGLPSGDASYSLYKYVPGSGYTVQENSGFLAISAVPEPTTWVMLLLGFFGVGFMMRGARRNDAVAVA